jgi:hypothetical protein
MDDGAGVFIGEGGFGDRGDFVGGHVGMVSLKYGGEWDEGREGLGGLLRRVLSIDTSDSSENVSSYLSC